MLNEYFDKKIIMSDGTEFYGHSFGSDEEKALELVFNTSMTGYQEIMSDKSYTDQAVVMTYPLIGNYGMADDDYESETPSAGALIVREYNDEPSNFRSRETLSAVMKRHGVAGVCGVDTRKLTRMIRDRGSSIALITDATVTKSDGLERLSKICVPKDSVRRASRKNTQIYGKRIGIDQKKIVLIDCGVKENIIRDLVKQGCTVTAVPWNTSYGKIMSLDPDGVLISNGPGDPEDVPETINTAKKLIGNIPVFGICLGHQIISLACGASTYKMKFGHHGGNHPVKDLETGRISITSQNHSYAVDPDSLGKTILKVTHLNLLDSTVEGVKSDKYPVFSVQYHPEAAPGPTESGYLFNSFIELIGKVKSYG
ncbi:MAG: glutamine-hydrolyzing carbamoyl-phosphate synthase small subunit [Clostridia bacterium]|nr:glutamine-hydrolyzing carbamoyl-phosphate synthase small subunit [Clostridia bacterium]